MIATKLDEVKFYYTLVTDFNVNGDRDELKKIIRFINAEIGANIKLNISRDSMHHEISLITDRGYDVLLNHYVKELNNLELCEKTFYEIDKVCDAYQNINKLLSKFLSHPNIPYELYIKRFFNHIESSLNNPVLPMLLLCDPNFYSDLTKHLSYGLPEFKSPFTFMTLNGETYMNYVQNFVNTWMGNVLHQGDVSLFNKYKREAELMRKHGVTVEYDVFEYYIQYQNKVYCCNMWHTQDIVEKIVNSIEDQLMSELMQDIDILFAQPTTVEAPIEQPVVKTKQSYQLYVCNWVNENTVVDALTTVIGIDNCWYDVESKVMTVYYFHECSDGTPYGLFELLNEWKYRDSIELIDDDGCSVDDQSCLN